MTLDEQLAQLTKMQQESEEAVFLRTLGTTEDQLIKLFSSLDVAKAVSSSSDAAAGAGVAENDAGADGKQKS